MATVAYIDRFRGVNTNIGGDTNVGLYIPVKGIAEVSPQLYEQRKQLGYECRSWTNSDMNVSYKIGDDAPDGLGLYTVWERYCDIKFYVDSTAINPLHSERTYEGNTIVFNQPSESPDVSYRFLGWELFMVTANGDEHLTSIKLGTQEDIASMLLGTEFDGVTTVKAIATWGVPHTVKFYEGDYLQFEEECYEGDSILMPNNPSIPGDILYGWYLSGAENTVYPVGTYFKMTYPSDLEFYSKRLKGHIKQKQNSSWNTSGVVWVKHNGEWKLGLPFQKVNGKWKHSL